MNNDYTCLMAASFSLEGHEARALTREEIEVLQNDKECVSDFKRNKLEIEARKNWDLFYKRNTTNFFKDRRWLTREFPELMQAITELSATGVQRPVLLEAGCGVGNTLFPLLEENSHLFIHACDFSLRAVEFVKSNPAYNNSRCAAFQCDLTADQLTSSISWSSVDLASLIFVLSSVSPEKMSTVIENVTEVLKPGGLVLFRDYGLYDHAMLRFSKGHKISEHFYVRQDGTRAYYFTCEEVRELFERADFKVIELRYVQRETVNHKENVHAQRIFVQGRFQKRTSDSDSSLQSSSLECSKDIK